MFSTLRHLLIGSPLPTQDLGEKRLNKVRALAVFSPDALSSIAYANQEIYLGLVVAGTAGLSLAFPIALAIGSLLAVVSLSYFQTIHAYPNGGGSYIVARENLGRLMGLVAAAALVIDYLLNAAVSLTAGVAALASAFPALWSYRVVLSLVLLAGITLVNLRGVRESGSLMAVPVYGFVVPFLLLLAYGVFLALSPRGPSPAVPEIPALVPVSLFLVLHAFSTGCTALTGIEAISNGVPAFQPPETRNAGRTLLVMAGLMLALFWGSTGLIQVFGVTAGPDETILSALVRRLVGTGPLYLFVQFATLAILTVAANTSFAGLPRLAALLAKDGFVPRQLSALGDRLVFSNGILLLSLGCGALIVLFNGDSHLLVPLFAISAFLAFTLSQSGMVVHWLHVRGRLWRLKAGINGLGAVVTLVTLLVVGIIMFRAGAWITLLLIPLLVVASMKVNAHYQEVARELSLTGLPPSLRPLPSMRVVVPVSGVHRGTVEAVTLAKSISSRVTAVYVELDPALTEKMLRKWQAWFPDIPLKVVPSPYRSIVGPFLECLDRLDREANDGLLAAVVLPEIIPARRWQYLLHNQTALVLRAALFYRRRQLGYQRVIIDVPHHLKR